MNEICKKLHELMRAEQVNLYEEVSSNPQPPASDDEIAELEKALGAAPRDGEVDA